MSKILVDTLTYRWRRLGDEYYFGRTTDNLFPSFDTSERRVYVSQFLTSILLHDEIYIKIDALEEVISILGIKEVLLLLQNNILKVVDDTGTMVGFLPSGDEHLLMNFSNSTALQFEAITSRLEKKFNGHFDNHQVKPLMYTVSDKSIQIDGAWLGHLAQEETMSDLRNLNITDFLNISPDYSNIIVREVDTLEVMRLSYLNRSLIYQHELKIKSLLTEATSKKIINLKFNPSIITPPLTAWTFLTKIIQDKQIPDFGELYIKGIVKMDDIIELRNSIDGGKFRDWMETEEYNKNSIYKKVLSSNSGVKEKALIKFTRWLYPNIVGFISPIGGVVVSIVESFVIDKILKGWHLTFFWMIDWLPC